MTDNAVLNFSPSSLPVIGSLARVVWAHGLASGESAALVLHALLLGLLNVLNNATVVVPLFVLTKAGTLAVPTAKALKAVVSLYLLRRGRLPKSALEYVVGLGLATTALMALRGGVRSQAFGILSVVTPALVMAGARSACVIGKLARDTHAIQYMAIGRDFRAGGA